MPGIRSGTAAAWSCRRARHHAVNTSKTAGLDLHTIYSPPEHQDGVVRKTKKEADEQKEHFDGKATE